MKGWLARIGVLLPSVNTILEPDFYAMAPEGVTTHTARLRRSTRISEDLPGGLREIDAMNEQIEEAADSVATAQVDVILYGCTGGSFMKGPEYNRDIIASIVEQTRIRATTTSSAVVNALKQLEIRTVAVVTPRPDYINVLEKGFLEGNGVAVAKIVGLGLTSDYASYDPYKTYRFAKEVVRDCLDEIDGIFISCTNFPSIEIIEALERDTRKPVVTSNQASFWEALRLAGVNVAITGYGRLLADPGDTNPAPSWGEVVVAEATKTMQTKQ